MVVGERAQRLRAQATVEKQLDSENPHQANKLTGLPVTLAPRESDALLWS